MNEWLMRVRRGLMHLAEEGLGGDGGDGGGGGPNVNMDEEPAFAPEAPATPAAPTAPVAPEDPEFEIEPGQKIKRSDLLAWRKSHEGFERAQPYIKLDEYLGQPQNATLGDAVAALLKSNDPNQHKAILDLLSGKAPEPAAQPSKPPIDELPADWEQTLDMDDPSIKSLVGIIKGLQGKVSSFEKFQTQSAQEREAAQKAEREKQAEQRLNQELDGSWKEHKFDDLLARLPEEDREEISKEMRARILFSVLQSQGKVPIPHVAKTVRERMSRLMDGIEKAYVTRKSGTPPQGGGRGPVGEPEPQIDDFDDPKLTERMAARFRSDGI